MTLRQRSYLTESKKVLNKLPPKTTISGSFLKFSSWDGKLALVQNADNSYCSTDSELKQWFDPDRLESKHVVRFAVGFGGKSIPAERRFINVEPDVADPRKPYEKTSFTIGDIAYGSGVRGTFSLPQTFWVKQTFKELNLVETKTVERRFKAKNFIEISDYRLSSKDWKAIIGMNFDEIQDKMPFEKGNEVDRLVTKLLGRFAKDDKEAEKIWKSFNGVYATNRRGDKIKFVVKR